MTAGADARMGARASECPVRRVGVTTQICICRKRRRRGRRRKIMSAPPRAAAAQLQRASSSPSPPKPRAPCASRRRRRREEEDHGRRGDGPGPNAARRGRPQVRFPASPPSRREPRGARGAGFRARDARAGRDDRASRREQGRRGGGVHRVGQDAGVRPAARGDLGEAGDALPEALRGRHRRLAHARACEADLRRRRAVFKHRLQTRRDEGYRKRRAPRCFSSAERTPPRTPRRLPNSAPSRSSARLVG